MEHRILALQSKKRITLTVLTYLKSTVQTQEQETCLNSTTKASERPQSRRFGVFIVKFEKISQTVLLFLLLTLNK